MYKIASKYKQSVTGLFDHWNNVIYESSIGNFLFSMNYNKLIIYYKIVRCFQKFEKYHN